jgi:hypothetical protein
MEHIPALAAWESFYVIVGSSGAALTGLQFVVIALVAETNNAGGPREIAAFGTPTVVHFCAVLLLAAIMSAPWSTLISPAIALGICGVFGIFYSTIVTVRARRQTGYAPVLEDWIWHIILPYASYGALLLAAAGIHSYTVFSLFVIGAVSLLLLFIGIHNAWDTVTYVATKPRVSTRPDMAKPGLS